MIKICYIQKILKDSFFENEEEAINFQILQSLSQSNFTVNIICAKNELTKEYNFSDIYKIQQENFYKNALKQAGTLSNTITFATTFIPADILYINKHTIIYNQQVTKAKLEAIFSQIINFRHYSNLIKDTQKQSTTNAKLIFTPSTILKNDLINSYHADGQNIYILPPSIKIPKNIIQKQNNLFTFGFIWKDFCDNGSLVLIKALLKLSDFHFQIKIIYPAETIPFALKYLIKILKLENKIQFLPPDTNMEDFFNKIDCFLVASKQETFSLCALDAMARGKILLVSSRTGVKDLIEPDNNGFLFDITKNPARNLARAMRYILANKNDFDNMRQKAMYTAAMHNFEKFKTDLIYAIENVFKEKEK